MQHRTSLTRTFSWIFIAAMAISSFTGLLPVESALAAAPSSRKTQPREEMRVEDVVKQVGDAVVTVLNFKLPPGASEPQFYGSGTGFIIDEDGHIVTNWHVTTGGDRYAVVLADGTLIEAEMIGEDPRDDLAVIKIDPGDIPAIVPFGDSDALNPGQTIIVIGSPLGLSNTVSTGVVSSIGRTELSSQINPDCQNYANVLQHTAAQNPGNSGGPLFNLWGEVVGVNTLGIDIINGQPIQGISFSIPSNLVSRIADQIIETGTIEAPYIGADFVALNPAISAAYGLPVDYGMYVRSIDDDTPAADAGMEAKDILVAIDGQEIGPARSLPLILFDYEPEDDVELTIIRDGKKRTLDLTLGQTPEEVLASCQAPH